MSEKENTIKTLIDFLDLAKRNRKYPPNTAKGIKAALKLFSNELNDDELHSMDLFKDRFNQIYQSVCLKNKTNMTLSSLETYKHRLQRLLRDYDIYGKDVTKMSNWNPSIVSKTKSSVTKINKTKKSSDYKKPEESNFPQIDNTGLDKYEISLTSNSKIVISYPSDITADEAARIEQFGSFLKNSRKVT